MLAAAFALAADVEPLVRSGPAIPSAINMLSRRINCESGGSSSGKFRRLIAKKNHKIEDVEGEDRSTCFLFDFAENLKKCGFKSTLIKCVFSKQQNSSLVQQKKNSRQSDTHLA